MNVGRLFSNRFFWIGATALGVIGVIAANAHLVMVAIASQPECVEHTKERGDKAGEYRAAKSGCAPSGEGNQ